MGSKPLKLISDRPHSARELGIMQGFPPPPEKRPTADNWDLAPFNRWSFQNMRSLLPTVDVDRGEGPVRPFDYALQDLNALPVTASDGERISLEECLRRTYTDGFLVLHRGKVVLEQYFNDMTPRTPHLSQSVAKSIVGTLAGILHGDGVLDLDAPIADRVPETEACGYADATVSQVLDMQTGVRFTEDYGVPGSDMTRIDIASSWRPTRPGEARPTIRDVILSLPKERAHGEVFSYRSVETDMLAWVLERETGQSLAQLLSERIWSKLGAERDGFFTVDGAATALADGGFNATLRDYARFGAMMLNGGKVGDRRIVPSFWVESLSRGETDKFGDPYNDLSPNGAYRRKWWVHDIARGDFMARGVFGQLIYVDREGDFLAVKLSTWPDFLIPAFSNLELRAIGAIRQALDA